MQSAENAFKRMTSSAKLTITKSIQDSLQPNNSSVEMEKVHLKQNSSSLPLEDTNPKWVLSSIETTFDVKPIEIQCELGSVLRNEFCGKMLLPQRLSV